TRTIERQPARDTARLTRATVVYRAGRKHHPSGQRAAWGHTTRAMKITRVRPWHVSGPAPETDVDAPRLSYVFVQVETDEGLTGWGEITTYPGTIANRTIVAALTEVGEFLQGEDAGQIEAIWHKLLRAFTYVGTRGATTAMISGIDIALWDIKGQALG